MIGFIRRKEIEEQRYQALKDCISEYLGDEGEKGEDLIEDIKRACQELKEYHSDRLDQFNLVETTIT